MGELCGVNAKRIIPRHSQHDVFVSARDWLAGAGARQTCCQIGREDTWLDSHREEWRGEGVGVVRGWRRERGTTASVATTSAL